MEARRLEVSRALGADWIVEKGLSAGDRLAMDNLQRIRPGMVVKPTPFQPPQAAAPAQGAAKPASAN